MSENIKKIGITGCNGFLGSHLKNYLNLLSDKYVVVPFQRSYFDDVKSLDDFVMNCDVIVHLAGLNRHNDKDILYNTNISLVNNLISSLLRTNAKPHVIFSSSIQEENNNTYGNSKKQGRENLSKWATNSNSIFTGCLIPNVFGPFGVPHYNSVVATFCHQLTHSLIPKIDIDGELNLIYISDLVLEIVNLIERRLHNDSYIVRFHHKIMVSSLLEKLQSYKISYFENSQIPKLANSFDVQLFNTFRSYIELSDYFPKLFTKHLDDRGAFVELIRTDVGGQFSFSSTNPGVTRGNHYHLRKIERFSVIKGKACIKLRKIGTENVYEFFLDGDMPAYVDMPIWYTHNITNIGEDTLYTCFWINELYNPLDSDTYLEFV